MSGLLRRLTRRRPATADETRSPTSESSEPAGAPAETPAEPGGGHPVPESGAAAGAQPPPDEQQTHVLPATTQQPAEAEPAPVRDLPAGIDPSELAVAPAPSASRGKLRRRLRYLRRVRELLLRDLGGFIFEIHRSAGGTPQEAFGRLVESKTNRIDALDSEVRALETRLGEPHAGALLREPGIGGLCPECGELHASDAHYCSRCGAPLDAKARAKRDAAAAAAAQPATGSHAPAAEHTPASVLWAAGPRPRAHPEPAKEETDPGPVTSQWLAIPRRDAAAAATRPAPKDEPEPGEPQPAADAGESPGAADGSSAPRGESPAAADDAPTAATDETAVIPAAEDAPTAATDETAVIPAAEDAKPRRTRARKPAEDEEADFEPAPNGKKDENVPPPVPQADPLSSRREQGS